MNHYLVTHHWLGVLPRKIYKLRAEASPTLSELKKIGAPIRLTRGDSYVIDKVSEELWLAVGAQWLRP